MKFAPFAALAAAMTLAGCGDSAAQADEEQTRRIVRDYLMENPELIRDALIELQGREAAAADEAIRFAAVAALPQITSDPRMPSIGPADAKVTIVEFYDYNCSFCQLASSWVEQAIESHPDDVRVVFVDYPILNARTGTSIEAAHAALAAAKQGKFKDMHFALYGASAALSSEEIDAIAQRVGVDVAQMRADMQNPEHGELIADTMMIADQIGVEGTPFFIVGDQIVPGADMETLQAYLDAALARS